MTRHNFSQPNKELLAKRVGYHCSNPSCGVSTIGPSNIDDDAEYVGVAAHIYSASVDNGPRANSNLTEEERGSISNAIHLCNKCSTLIDKNNGAGYPASVLFGWKKQAENIARNRVYSISAVNTYKALNFSNLEKDYSTALSCTGLTEKNVKSCPQNGALITEIKNKLNLANKCIIMGVSGSGKSLLTYQVALSFYQNGFSIFNINKDSISEQFSLVLPHEKSVVVIDDAQTLNQQHLEEILKNAYQDCLVLVNWNSSTSTEDEFLKSFPCVEISNKSQVKLIEKYCLENKEAIADKLINIGLNINKKSHYDRIEERIKRAACEQTPWLFNYSLTEGWNSAKQDLNVLDSNQKLSIVILTVSIYQISTLDRGVKKSVILAKLREFNPDNEWLEKATTTITKYCLTIDGYIKNRHYEYSLKLLILYLSQDRPKEEINYLINLILSVLQSETYLSGHSNLLEFVIFDFRSGGYELKRRGFTKELALNVLQSNIPIEEKPAIVRTLNSLIRLDGSLIELLEDSHEVISNWISQVGRNSAFLLGDLLNTLINGKLQNLRLTCYHLDSTFQKLFDAHPEDKPRYSYLINRMGFFLTDELKEYAKELLITENLPLNINSFSSNTVCYQFAKLIDELAYINPDWADEQVANNINGLGNLLNRNLMDAYSSLSDLMGNYFGITAVILGIPINDSRLKKRAKNLANILDVESILRAFQKLEVVDVQSYSNVLIFLALYNPKKLKVVSDRFDYERLYKIYEDDKKLDHYNRLLISLLHNNDSNNYQEYINSIIKKYNNLEQLFLIVSPESTMEKIKQGMRYSIDLERDSKCKNELIILKEIIMGKDGKIIVNNIFNENLEVISKAIFNKAINVDNSKTKIQFLLLVNSVSPDLFNKIFSDSVKNIGLIEKISRLIKGSKLEKQHAKLYLFLLKKHSKEYIFELEVLEKRYPSISRFDISQFE